jgi:hypothetical protein
MPGKKKDKWWHCKACAAPPTCYEDVWGFHIEQPPNSLRPNCLWVSSVPLAIRPSMEPAEAHTFAESVRSTQLKDAEARYIRQGGREAVDGAGHWMQMFKEINLSQGAQQHVITGVHAINDAGLLVRPFGERADLNLPRNLETLQLRGAGTRVLDKDIPVVHTKFCMRSMRQLKEECGVVRSDAAPLFKAFYWMPIPRQGHSCSKSDQTGPGNIVMSTAMNCVALKLGTEAGCWN